MKQLSRILLAAGFVALTACGAQADTPPKDLKTILTKKLGRPVDSVNGTPIKGVYEVVLGKRQIIYSDAQGNYAFIGDLVDISKKESLTEKRLAEMMKTDFAKLPLADAIKEVRGDGSRKLAVFTDPDCPFCKRLEQQSLDGVTNTTIYYFLMPLTQLHPDAERKSKAIWCAPNRLAAHTDWMLQGKLADNAADCDNPIARNIELGAALGISGTPALVFGNGEIVSGAIPKDELEALLTKNSKSGK